MPPSASLRKRPVRSPARKRAASNNALAGQGLEGEDAAMQAAVMILEARLSSQATSSTDHGPERAAGWALLLSELRRLLKLDRRALLTLLKKPQEGLQLAGERVQHRRAAVVRRVRKRITGDEDRRVRDVGRARLMAVRNVLERPPAIQLRDKFSFMFGVLGCGVVEAVALLQPDHFWMCYVVYIVPLLVARLYLYCGLGWHYFLLDFCYASNLSCLAHIFIWPNSTTLFIMNFVHTTGPLAMAIPTWRNSLVFHSLDKVQRSCATHVTYYDQSLTIVFAAATHGQVTSAYIHAMPPLLCFLIRWYPPWSSLDVPEHLDIGRAIYTSLAGYGVWQVVHLVCTELIFPASDTYDTSIRTLTRPKPLKPPPGCYTGITKPVYILMLKAGVMRDGELFDPEHWKTKFVFISVQFLYTCATVVPACYIWSSKDAHLAYLAAILVVCVWNGASYYIEVFSKAYRKQFEDRFDDSAAEQSHFQTDVLADSIKGTTDETGVDMEEPVQEAIADIAQVALADAD